MDERIEQLHRVAVFNRVSTLRVEVWITGLVIGHRSDPLCIVGVLGNYVEDLDLVIGSLSVV